MTIRFTTEALAELGEVLDYIATQSPQGARNVNTQIQTILANLVEHPLTGISTSIPKMRRIAVTPYPYLIFYLAGHEEVIIVGIRHALRDPSSMPDRS
jgi:addiction module RelE/StbE family toxin